MDLPATTGSEQELMSIVVNFLVDCPKCDETNVSSSAYMAYQPNSQGDIDIDVQLTLGQRRWTCANGHQFFTADIEVWSQ